MDWPRTVRSLLTLGAIVALCYVAWMRLAPRNADVMPPKENTPLLQITSLKDGDSWDASDGREYRLGLVNAPEALARCGREATQFTRRFLIGGFTAYAYAKDVHGRIVAEVFNRSGQSLNIALVRAGYSDSRYLNHFRHENPELGHRLDLAFARTATPACERAR